MLRKKIQQAQSRFKELFATNIHNGMAPKQAADAATKTLKGEFKGVAEWIAILTALMPLIQQLIALFSK